MRTSTLLCVLVLSVPALAEERALTVEAGGGAGALLLPVPAAAPASASLGTTAVVRGGVRYGLFHWLDVGVGGFFEPEVTYLHRGVSLYSPDDPERLELRDGALRHRMARLGAAASVRLAFGLQCRFFVQADLGWSRRLYSRLEGYNTSNPAGAIPSPLTLTDFAADNLSASLGLGVEYQLTDAIALSVAPRLEALVGPEATYAVTLPLLVSWSWIQ